MDSGQAGILDWDLDFLEFDSHSGFHQSDIDSFTKTQVLIPTNTLVTPNRSANSSPDLLEDIKSLGNGDGDTDMEELRIYESDEEEQANYSCDSAADARRRAISGLEQIVLSFLEQVGTKRLELKLANRSKTNEDGSVVHRVLRWPKRTKKGSLRSFACLLRVVDLVHEALMSDIPTTKRDIFYKDVPLFKSQPVVNDLVDDLAATLDVTRADLNVRASPKGLFCGSGLTIHLRRGGTVHGNDADGALIPAGAEVSRLELDGAVSWVLVVEKEAVFQTLCTASLSSNPSCPGSGIIITGKGYPDLATRELVSRLSHTLHTSVPILALVDADAYGLDILSVYRFGSQSLSHERHTTTAPRIEWLGLWGSELTRLGIDRDDLIPLTKHDHKKALAMLRRSNTIMPTQWRKELMHMLHTRRKAEIEIISSASRLLPHLNNRYQSLVPDIFRDDDVPAAEAPLVTYLVPKLHSWVASA